MVHVRLRLCWDIWRECAITTRTVLAGPGADYIKYITGKEHAQENDEDNSVCVWGGG